MKKKSLSILALTVWSVGLTVQAQENRMKETIIPGGISFRPPVSGKTAIVGCDTLSILTNANATIYRANISSVPACTPNSGYVTGNNCLGDKEKASFFDASIYSTLNTPQVSGVIVAFYKDGTGGTSGASTNTVGLTIYNGTSAGSSPGSVAGTTSLPMSTIMAGFAGGANVGLATFNFASPLTVTTSGGFWASVVLPNQATSDTVVIIQQSGSTSNVSFEKAADNSWRDMSLLWGVGVRMWIFPIMNCSSKTTGIETETLEKLFTVIPNPSSGTFSLIATLNGLNYDFTITNSIGQQVLQKHNISGGSSQQLDLADLNAGIYFLNIKTEQGQTLIKKLVISK